MIHQIIKRKRVGFCCKFKVKYIEYRQVGWYYFIKNKKNKNTFKFNNEKLNMIVEYHDILFMHRYEHFGCFKQDGTVRNIRTRCTRVKNDLIFIPLYLMCAWTMLT